MNFFTLNFLTCAVKDCKPNPAAFPLEIPKEGLKLVVVEMDFQPLFWRNVLPRIQWDALRKIAKELNEILKEGLEAVKEDPQSLFLRNMFPRIQSDAVLETAEKLHEELNDILKMKFPADFEALGKKEDDNKMDTEGENVKEKKEEVYDDKSLRKLHTLLYEKGIYYGTLKCRVCEHEYAVRDGIANFLLPPHKV